MSAGLVIIGSGLAGYMLAKEWRKYDTTSPLTIITSGKGDFYSKPLLSTALTQQREPAVLPTASATQMAEQLNARLLTEAVVTGISPGDKTIALADKTLHYEHLVLAVGADPIKADIKGSGAKEVVVVNGLEDYVAFRKVLKPHARVAILGAGLVGCEFSNDLTNVGCPVDIIALSTYPLDRLLPPEMGAVVKTALSKTGVHWHLSQAVECIEREHEHYALTLSAGTVLKADIVMSAIGLRPHVALAQTAGLRCGRGVLVNRFLETSAPSIYALGDCAEVCGTVLQYVAPLLACSRALAKTLSGERTAVQYPTMPVVLKTPACPVVVAPPPQDLEGEWQVKGEALDRSALFYDTAKQLRGFALTGTMVKERANLQKQLPPIFDSEGDD